MRGKGFNAHSTENINLKIQENKGKFLNFNYGLQFNNAFLELSLN